jgi:cation diffusion facilitator family transporter
MGGHDHAHGTHVYTSRDAVRAVIVSAVVLGAAAAFEFAAGLIGGSAGVLADALHNTGDVATTFVLLVAFSLARRPATRQFPWGYGRIEDVATLLIIVIIVVTAAAAAVESILKFLHPGDYGSIPLALAAAAAGVVANLAVSEYKVRVGRGINSPALEADGIHSRIDALVSAGAFVGIGLAGLGLRLADPIAGLLITVMILYILAGTVRQLFLRMMDAVDPHVIEELTEAAGGVDGVLGVHDVRARWVGRELAAVLTVDCDPDASLQDAHEVATRVDHAVSHVLPEARLDIHMDPGRSEHEHRGHPAGSREDRSEDRSEDRPEHKAEHEAEHHHH